MIATISFHLDDEYFCGIRANHFLVEYGYTEASEANYFVVTGNHKGYRQTVYFKNKDPILDKFSEKLELTVPKYRKQSDFFSLSAAKSAHDTKSLGIQIMTRLFF